MSDASLLQIPADFERLPEFRTLASLLKIAGTKPLAAGLAEPTATFLWMRLWVELAFLARTTNKPGRLARESFRLFEETVNGLFGDDANPIGLLEQSGLLKPIEGSEDLFCERFARDNGHFSGDYVSREVKGANASALARQRMQVAKEANAQAMLLPPEVYRKRDGSDMNATEIQRSMVLIKTLDNCLKRSTRKRSEYTQGLIADAWSAADACDAEELREIYLWVANHREHPAVPKSAESILARWEEMRALVRIEP